MSHLTDKEKLDMALEALKSIAAFHLPEANTIGFWMSRSIDDSFTVLAQDTDLARTVLKDLGEEI